ncbi:MAG: hypothetical protein M1370_04110 [Bacteroidetes bacterium]|nr:hypothetical protein [Bacteroidota bacterium]MCL5025246.1 hypothetical protein [Chloroflexota bacterium]
MRNTDAKEPQDSYESENWDYENAEKRTGVKMPRAIVSVAFSREDFETVADHAHRLGMKTSEFIRQAALEKVKHRAGRGIVLSSSASSGSATVVKEFAPSTSVLSKWSQQVQEEAFTS